MPNQQPNFGLLSDDVPLSQLDARYMKVTDLVAGTFPWPQGLVALWDFQRDTAGGSTVTSRVGSQVSTLTALASKTVVKDAADPGPFGPSLVLDGATVFAKSGGLGALDVSKTGDEVTVIAWVKDTRTPHDSGVNGISSRAGSHCEPGDAPARQYDLYFDAFGAIGYRTGHLTPHIGAQDGATPGYPYNLDYAASHRAINTGTGQGEWHMEAMTFDGNQITAYIDGLADTWNNVLGPVWTSVDPMYTSAMRQFCNRNPYTLPKGINRSTTTKRFAIGGSTQSTAGVVNGINYTTGKLGGVAVFNRALSAKDIMKIRLATMLPGEAITKYGFEVSQEGDHSLDEVGWTAKSSANGLDTSTLTSIGAQYAVARPAGGQKAYLRKTSTAIGAAWIPIAGLNSSQLRSIRCKMLSAATTAAPQRLLVKVADQWWASNATLATTGAHASNTDWSGAESKTLAIDWAAGNWRPVTLSDSGSTANFTNIIKNPSLNVDATNWYKSSSLTNASAARVDTGLGYSAYRITWTGAGSAAASTIGGSSQANVASGGVTAGTDYAASLLVNAAGAAGTGRQLVLSIIWYDVSNNQISTTDGMMIDCAFGIPTRLTASGTAPTGASTANLIVKSISGFGSPAWVSGDTLDLAQAMMVAGAGLPPIFFDGTTVGAAWTGSANASSSTYTGMSTGVLTLSGSTNAVPVDNALLTAVGFLSSGGDGSAVRVTDLELLAA